MHSIVVFLGVCGAVGDNINDSNITQKHPTWLNELKHQFRHMIWKRPRTQRAHMTSPGHVWVAWSKSYGYSAYRFGAIRFGRNTESDSQKKIVSGRNSWLRVVHTILNLDLEYKKNLESGKILPGVSGYLGACMWLQPSCIVLWARKLGLSSIKIARDVTCFDPRWNIWRGEPG